MSSEKAVRSARCECCRACASFRDSFRLSEGWGFRVSLSLKLSLRFPFCGGLINRWRYLPYSRRTLDIAKRNLGERRLKIVVEESFSHGNMVEIS